MTTNLAAILLLFFCIGIAATEGLYCYHLDDAEETDREYEKCGAACIKGSFDYAEYATRIFQGCGNCSEPGMPAMIACEECGTHLCNEANKQSLEDVLMAMGLWTKQVRDDKVLQDMLEPHLGIVRLMQKKGLQELLGKLLEKSRYSFSKLFGMRAMDTLIDYSWVLEKMADNPKKLRLFVWNPAKYGHLHYPRDFGIWLDQQDF